MPVSKKQLLNHIKYQFYSFSFNFTSKSQISSFQLLYALITLKRTQLLSVVFCQILIISVLLYYKTLSSKNPLRTKIPMLQHCPQQFPHTPQQVSIVPPQKNKQKTKIFLNTRILLDNSSRDNWYVKYSRGNQEKSILCLRKEKTQKMRLQSCVCM